MPEFSFSQINVFSSEPLKGNPVAVVHAAESLGEEQMASLARWTNLSETTFLLPADDENADYKLRIFTPNGELPFAGHPTLGSCQAWLKSGGVPKHSDTIVQECGVGLVSICTRDDLLEFAAPPLIRTGPLDDETFGKITHALSLAADDVVRHQWIDNGPGWCGLLLASAEKLRGLRPNWAELSPLNLGVAAIDSSASTIDLEVRGFVGDGGFEDPVTGSLNASMAQWLVGSGIIEAPYVAAQGMNCQREGRVHVREHNGQIWVGGAAVEVVKGSITI